MDVNITHKSSPELSLFSTRAELISPETAIRSPPPTKVEVNLYRIPRNVSITELLMLEINQVFVNAITLKFVPRILLYTCHQ